MLMAAKTRKLGRHASPPNPRLLKLGNYLDVAALPAAPTTTTWAAKVKGWGSMLNDKLGCCTVSAAGHAIQLWTANDATQVTVPDSAILAAYKAVSGYNGTPRTDNGANMIDVLKYWRETGVGGRKGIGYVGVDPKNLDQVRAALWLFGGLYGGCQIPTAWLSGAWDKAPGGLAGGHAFWVVDRTGSDFTSMTWGEIRRFTLAGWQQCMQGQQDAELYAVLGPEWTGPDMKAPSGFDIKALQNDLAIIAGQPLPNPVDPTPPPNPTGQSISVSVLVNTTTFAGTLYPKP